MPDTARSVARELVEQVGWPAAVSYMLGRLWQEAKLLAAVVFV